MNGRHCAFRDDCEDIVEATHRLVDRLDLACDEFKRIAACPGATDEIKQLCERGQKDIKQHVHVIEQRDQLQKKLDLLTGHILLLRNLLGDTDAKLP